MTEPSPRKSRLVLAGSLAAAVAVGSAGFVLGRRWAPAPIPSPVPQTAIAPTGQPTPTMPVDRVFDRAGVLALAALAADATAQGKPTASRDAVGTRFSFAIPFGCSGPLAPGDDVGTGWRYDTGEGVLRLQVAPVRWMPKDWWAAPVPAGIDAIEGFWIAWPWSSGETCPTGALPPAAPGIETITLPGQTLAIAQVYTSDGPRTGRRDDQPYVTVLRVPPEAVRTARGFRIRLSGRIAALPGGDRVRCRQPGGPEQRPICLVAARIDDISIENAATGDTLARWGDVAATPGSRRNRP